MTNTTNAERLRAAYLRNQHAESKARNICTARRNWNGCDYADIYAGAGLECWKQGALHACIRCERREGAQK